MSPMESCILLMIFSTVHSGPAGCPNGWSLFGPNCYKLVETLKTWQEAENHCQTEGAHLASLHSEEEKDFVGGLTSHQWEHWLGGTRKSGETWQWSDLTPFSYTNWRPTEPNNSEGKENCIEFQGSNLQWNDISCNFKARFVCKMTSDGCPNSWSWSNHGKKCYKLFQNRLGWYDAEVFCQGEGGNLVSVHSKAENEFVARLDSDLRTLWLGGIDVTSENNRWLWSDGSPFSFTNWRKNEPNNVGGIEDCLELGTWKNNHVWNDNRCSRRMKFVCEKTL